MKSDHQFKEQGDGAELFQFEQVREARHVNPLSGIFTLLQQIVHKINEGQLLLLACVLVIFFLLLLVALSNRPDSMEIIKLGLGILAVGPLLAFLLYLYGPAPCHEVHAVERKLMKLQLGKPKDLLSHQQFGETIRAIMKNLDCALEIEHPVFQETIVRHFSDLWRRSALWERHEMDVSGSLYKRALIDFYYEAETSVFATCLPDYFDTWQGRLGRCLLEAHARGKASVRRVFIFSTRSDVTAEHIDALKKLQASFNDPNKMQLYIWIEDEHVPPYFHLVPSKDFTVIDQGRVIGFTLNLGTGMVSAKWYFASQPYGNICNDIIADIMQGAESYDKFRLGH